MIIYPAIDLRGGQCVRLIQGDYARETVFAANPIQPALDWVRQGADRLHLVDLDGAKVGQPINRDVISRIVQESKVPCQLGGGIRTEEDLDTVFGWGIQWAVLGTKALQDPAWVREMATKFPGRIVLGLDARNGFVATDGWLNTSTTKATDLARLVETAPLFAVVYTDIARDGMMQGPNIEALNEMRAATRLPVIASGGVSNLAQAAELAGLGTFAAIIGRALYEGAISLPEALKLGKPGR
ncbi:MAG: 1-(5-phosphoribosyl)-5-[(5-phosphoribosylamino)methylideneamino]imidazole-4-carboxamide isomerase [Fimbriiglobus sp.]